VTLGQIIQRSENPRLVYELRPRLDVRFANGHLTTSDAGYRGGDAVIPKPVGRYRIVGIGDSYMFGQGVSDEETYLSRLPAAFTAITAIDAGRRIDTVNLAAPGYNTVMEVESLKERWAALDGDLILIEIVGNDLDLPNFLWKTVDPWTLRRSFLLDFVRQRLSPVVRDENNVAGLSEAPLSSSAGHETFSRDAEHVPPEYASMVGLASFETALRDLARFAVDRKVPVLAVTHGVWFEADMLRALDTNHIPVLVLRSALRRRAKALGAPDYPRSPLATSPNDLHPSAAGHLAIADELAEWIPHNVVLGSSH
ncbi:MAG: SGNH/GDSL hydrolase family protein, partial [Vicinamibacteria bacterium]